MEQIRELDCVAQMPMLHLKAATALTRLSRDTGCWSWPPSTFNLALPLKGGGAS